MTRPTGFILAVCVLLSAPPARARTAKEILDATGVTGGLVVHVGCGDGKLTAGLRVNDRIVVHGLDADTRNVAAARKTVRRAHPVAKVWVDRLEGEALPHAENMVNLLVSEDLGAVTMAEVMRVLVPRGVAYVKTGGRWVKTAKPWPGEIDEWTHWQHGADGNPVARDAQVGPPRRLKWQAGPLWMRSHDSVPSPTALVSARGRIFYIVDEAPASMDGSAPDKWALVARDAFNGLPLWRKPIDSWGWRSWARRFTVRFTMPTHVPRRLVAVGDRVYVTLGFNAPLTELDAATGEVLRTFKTTQFTDEILCDDGLLIVATNKGFQKPGPRDGPSPEPVRKSVAAIDAKTGEMRWKVGDYVGLRSKTGPMERISHLSMTAGGGKVFFVDGRKLIALDQADGSEAWRVDRPEVPEHKMRYNIRFTDMCATLYNDGRLFLTQVDPGSKRVGWREVNAKVHAFDAATGKEIWNRQCSSWGWGHHADLFLRKGLVWVTGYKNDMVMGLDPKTGEIRQEVSNRKAFDNGHHHRCYRNRATERFVVTSYRGIELIDWDSGETALQHWVRGTCRLGVMPCNGLIYATPHPCECYITSKLNGFLALAPKRATKPEATGGPRLEKGPAYDSANPQSTVRDPQSGWSMYRRDAARSGSTPQRVRTPLRTAWQAKVGGVLTSPVAADGRVIVASKTTRSVVCLAAGSGTERWRFTAGGSLDTPPTIAAGRVVFGCMDGSAYCLRATDGELAWRFRAAPAERLVGAFGSLESAWPVHGSVLVDGGRVTFTAGRSSFLDGGVFAYTLDLETGEVLARETIASDHDMPIGVGTKPVVDTGVLSDLLVAHAGKTYLRQRPLFSKGLTADRPMHLHSTSGLLDDSWFHRTRWWLGGVAMAEYFVFSDTHLYGVRARRAIGGYGLHFAPGAEGFDLFASARPAMPQPKLEPLPAARRRGETDPADKRKKRAAKPARFKVAKPKDIWCIKVPVRINAMVLAGRTLIAAGTPDLIVPGDSWAAYEGRHGGRLLVVNAADGKVQGEIKLPAPPVLDGLAAANGRLFMSAGDGKVVCFGAK